MARRAIEQAWATREGEVTMLALDWAKAFDSISPAAMSCALRRFGLPDEFVAMVDAIYDNRRFHVKDCGNVSTWRTQRFGICQGCPLSPFLFVIVMTVMLEDVRDKLVASDAYDTPDDFPSELVYADDTLILAMNSKSAQTYMQHVAEEGSKYGLSFNWRKLETLGVRTVTNITKPDGVRVTQKGSIKYLGAMLSDDGRLAAELGRRIGAARQEFDTLRRVWKHSSINLPKKLRILDACVMSKLVYGLSAAALNQAERRRLDGFQARCLRQVLGIPPAYHSRVPNTTVLLRAGAQPISTQILKQQMVLMGRVARGDLGTDARRAFFAEGTHRLRPGSMPRPVGRPRCTWRDSVYQHCLKAAGSEQQLANYFQSGPGAANRWRSAIVQYIIS